VTRPTGVIIESCGGKALETVNVGVRRQSNHHYASFKETSA